MNRLFNTKLDHMSDLLLQQMEDVYDAEKRLCKALPKMAEAATNPQLRAALQNHLKETEQHVLRLEDAFAKFGQRSARETCDAMKGLITEGEEVISARGDDDVRDAAIIAAAQRVEHYEIASYGTLRSFAQRLGRADLADIFQRTLDEEGAADKKLTDIAESWVNRQAAA